MSHLTISQQNYIKTVYELSFEGRGTRICDIALKHDVSKARVCIAMKTLQKKKLVYWGGYRGDILPNQSNIRLKIKLPLSKSF